jgi:asparagine synthase (glutamine-hydrolysing)
MMSDVPFGVFLSAGVDSSTNVALMSELMSDPVRTFSVAFAEHEQYNELEYARRVAQRYGTDHHEVVIDWTTSSAFLPEMVHHQDEPIADWVCVPCTYVSKLGARLRHDRRAGR